MKEREENEEYIVNIRTGERIRRPEPIDEEVKFDGGVMITETDTKGIITYANKKFREMTGYSKEELVGAPHSINRHPDMPKGAFRGMWKTIASKKIWRGYVKNLRKDGKFYWVLVYIQPKFDREGRLVGFIAGRKVAYPHEIEKHEALYKEYKGDEHIDSEVFESNYGEFVDKNTQ